MNLWTWIAGNSTATKVQDGVSILNTPYMRPIPGGEYGTMYYGSNTTGPPARQFAAGCVMTERNSLVLFGGAFKWDGDLHFTNGTYEFYNDLWEFSLDTNEWTWIAGSSLANQSDSVNDPPQFPDARYGSWLACYDTPTASSVYMHGGWLANSDTPNSITTTNDLWKYSFDASNWTRLSDFNDAPFASDYETLVAPYLRYLSSSAVLEPNSKVLLYGGIVDTTYYSSMPSLCSMGDLWMFLLENETWVSLSGNAYGNPNPDFGWEYIGVYGQPGVFNSSNIPGSRGGAHIAVSGDSVFLYGGLLGYTSSAVTRSDFLGDIWEFSMSKYQWRWVSGSSTEQLTGIAPVNDSIVNFLARGHSSGWINEKTGMHYFFGGYVLYDPTYYSAVEGYTPEVLNDFWKFQYPLNCTLGSYFNTTTSSCVACRAGRFSSSYNASQCILCDSGYYSDCDGLSECKSCPAGKSSTLIGATACKSCSPGKFSPTSGYSCLSCAPGMFSNSSGLTTCDTCGKNSFAATNASLCIKCIDGSSTISTYASSIYDCVCGLDFYGKPFKGDSCKKCRAIEGLNCPVNSSIPKISVGYFRDPSDVSNAYACTPAAACTFTNDSDENTTCSTGYSGFLCGQCVSGYYRQGLQCTVCPGNASKIFTVLAVIFVGAVILYYFTKASVRIAVEYKVMLFWAQIISTYSNVSTTWPANVSGFLQFSNIVNFNFVELVSPGEN